MKRLVLLLLALVSIAGQANDILVGVGDQNGEALSVRDGLFVGSLAKFYQCPFDRLGMDYELRLMPQVRNLYLLERGDIDIVLPLVEVSKRNTYAIFTRKMIDIPFVLFSRVEIDLSADLAGYRFAVLRESASGDLVLRRNAQMEEVTSWVQSLRLAKLGRFDGAVIPAPVIADVDPGLFEGMQQYEFGSIPLSLYVSRKSPHASDLVERINAAIAECQR